MAFLCRRLLGAHLARTTLQVRVSIPSVARFCAAYAELVLSRALACALLRSIHVVALELWCLESVVRPNVVEELVPIELAISRRQDARL